MASFVTGGSILRRGSILSKILIVAASELNCARTRKRRGLSPVVARAKCAHFFENPCKSSHSAKPSTQ